MLNVNIMVLVSGGGTNLQALLDAEKYGKLGPGKLTVVVSDRPEAKAIERVKLWNIPVYVEEPQMALPINERRRELSDRIFRTARDYNVRIIVLAGFLSILSGKIIQYYSGRILNLHPSLLPKYGGNGMYGEKVHRAVLDANEKESGCTVHIVDNGVDTGPILLQRKIKVHNGDTPETLAERIHDEEHIAIVEAVKMISEQQALVLQTLAAQQPKVAPLPNLAQLPNDTQLSNLAQLPNDTQLSNLAQLPNDAQLPNLAQLPNDAQLPNLALLPNDAQLPAEVQLPKDVTED